MTAGSNPIVVVDVKGEVGVGNGTAVISARGDYGVIIDPKAVEVYHHLGYILPTNHRTKDIHITPYLIAITL